METKTPTTTPYHHQRAPRTPESYFNVPESIALLNIVKSERIQSAFQSNRKNHASVWEMVAEVLNRFSARKRSAKQCCNRYENLKKIYTQLKKNPERHVRRNWPYMFLFKEIEEQRGECWGSNGKRLSLITKNHKELSYYHRRRQAAELGLLLNKDAVTAAAMAAQHGLLQTLAAHSNDSNNSCGNGKYLANHFVETQLSEGGYDDDVTPMSMSMVSMHRGAEADDGDDGYRGMGGGRRHTSAGEINGHVGMENGKHEAMGGGDQEHHSEHRSNGHFVKDSNGALNLQTNEHNISMKSEPHSDGEFNPDDIQLMQTNYNGNQSYYPHNIDPNIMNPDVILDTDNLSECSSSSSKSKRKMSTSTDGDSTNYELIEYLKRREKRDEELMKRMDEREERLVALLERTVVAIEALANKKCCPNNNAQPTTTTSPAAEV